MTPIERMRRIVTGAGKAGARNAAPMANKASAVGGLGGSAETWLMGPAPANWTSRRYDRFAEEGYRKNVIAYRSVRLIAEGAASIPWLLYTGDREVVTHPLLNLLKRPNPMTDGASFLEAAYGFLLIAGNAYIEAVATARGLPGELYALRPDRMKVIPGIKGWPRGYQYSVAGQSHLFEHDPARGVTPILHLKSFHPLDDHYGLSAFDPAAFGIDLHNESATWNKALLDNAARPSGALVYDPGEAGASLTPEQFERLKAEMEEQFQGGRNAGRPLLLEGGLSWQQLGFSPADMDFINAKHVSAREIALAFGVPPMLLGIPGDNTYANYAEANRALWRQAILPMARKLTAALNAWLAPKFGEGLRLDINTDAIEALSADRAQTWARVGAATFLTTNEKRAALGYEPIEGGDTLQPAMPGAFTTKALTSKGVIDDRAARYADLLREHEVAVEAGATVKTWKTAGDGNVRHSHAVMEGVTVPIDDDFEVGGERLFLPSDPSASLAETAGCRCYVAYSPGRPGGQDDTQAKLSECRQIAVDIGNAELQIADMNRQIEELLKEIEEHTREIARKENREDLLSRVDFSMGLLGAGLAVFTGGTSAIVQVFAAFASRMVALLQLTGDAQRDYDAFVKGQQALVTDLFESINQKTEETIELRAKQKALGCPIN